MTTDKHCSFRTFWLGFRDWLGSRMSMTHLEAIQEVRERHNPFFPFKLLGIAAAILLTLFIGVFTAPVLVQYSTAAGITSWHVLFASQWGTVIAIVAVTGALLITKIRRLIRFIREMCKRGQALETARSRTGILPQ